MLLNTIQTEEHHQVLSFFDIINVLYTPSIHLSTTKSYLNEHCGVVLGFNGPSVVYVLSALLWYIYGTD